MLLQNPHDYNNIMMWAACCLAFFGFLHSSELTTRTSTEFDLDIHLSAKDLATDNKLTPWLVRERIKQSKMDPFWQGVMLFLGKTGSSISPVDAILPYLAVKDNHPGPLFIFRDGHMLTRQTFGPHWIMSWINCTCHRESLTLTASEFELQLQPRKPG